MKRILWIIFIMVIVVSVSGCARTKRIANDVDWIVFDGEPNKAN
jgi:hypothetical protein